MKFFLLQVRQSSRKFSRKSEIYAHQKKNPAGIQQGGVNLYDVSGCFWENSIFLGGLSQLVSG